MPRISKKKSQVLKSPDRLKGKGGPVSDAAIRARERRANRTPGSCITCVDNPARPNRSTCEKCSDAAKLRAAARKRDMMKKGYCRDCSNRKARKGMATCKQCSEGSTERHRRAVAKGTTPANRGRALTI